MHFLSLRLNHSKLNMSETLKAQKQVYSNRLLVADTHTKYYIVIIMDALFFIKKWTLSRVVQALKPAANGRCLVCKTTRLVTLPYRSTFILQSVKSACWVFLCFCNPPKLTWTTGSLTCVRDSNAWVYTRGLGTRTYSNNKHTDQGFR